MGKRKYESKEQDQKSAKQTKNEGHNETLDTTQETHEDIPQTSNEEAGAEFNVKHFRKELAAKQGQTVALTQFLQVCTNPDMKHDYMLEYLKAGGNSHEILRQISTDSKKNLTLATPTFHLFHLIIVKVQSSLPHMISITEEACRYFLNTFMPTVEIMISEHSGPRHRKIILKLLTSMVTLNPDLGVEILNQAPLTPKQLQYIVEKPNYKEKDNVRTTFVHFITSFIVEGHLPLIKALLEKQGLLPLVIPGLIQDEAEAVIMFLNILKANVIENILISKSLKLKTFSHLVLHNLFKVFYWKGPPDVDQVGKHEMQSMITSLLSEIILILFTSHKFGLYFIDKTLGTSDAHKNQNLYKALLSLKRPWENKGQCELILKIIDKCPDLHRALISIIEQSFDPQNTPVWLNAAAFVCTLLDKIKIQDVIERMKELSPIQVTNFVRFTTLPIPLLKFLKQGIAKEDMFVITECLKVIVKMLTTMKKYMNALEMSDPTINELLRNRLEGFLPKHLPAPETLVTLIHQLIKNDRSSKTSLDASQVEKSTTLIGILDVLILYSEIYPPCLEGIEGHLDMKNILTYTETLTFDNVLLLKFKIVSLWLILDPTAISLQKPMFRDLFLIMLEVFTDIDEEISAQSKSTLQSFLKTTSIFEGVEGEIDIVLHSLKNARVNPPSVLFDVMQHTISNVDKLKEAIITQVENLGLKASTESTGLHKLLDDLSEEKVQNIDYNILVDTKLPSPFFLGCLQVSKNSRSNRSALKNFVSLFSINLLHNYTSPELISALLEPFKSESKPYISGWITEPVLISEELAQGDELIKKLCYYIIDDSIKFDEIFPHFEIVEKDKSDITVRELNLKWASTVPTDSSELLVCANVVIFYVLQFSKLGILTEEKLEKITLSFDAIMAICKHNQMIDVGRKILYNIFTNPNLITYYSPIGKDNQVSHKHCTKFLVGVVEQYGQELVYLHSRIKLMKPYQHKNYIKVKKAIENISKNMTINNELTMKILEVIGMNKSDTLQIIDIILNVDLKYAVTQNKEPSLIMNVLGHILSNAATNSDDLPSEVVSNIFDLYTNILKDPEINVSLIDFESILEQYFEKKPQHVKLISKDSFKNFFSSKVIRKSTSLLAAALLKRNELLCEVFKEEILNPDIIGQRELALPLGEAVINHTQFVDENKSLLEQIFTEYKLSIQKVLEKPHKVGQIYSSNWRFVRKLVYECMPIEDCNKFFEKIHKFETAEIFHVELIQATFMKVCVASETPKKEYLINYFNMMIGLLSAALKAGAEYEVLKCTIVDIANIAQISKCVKAFDTKNKEHFKKITESALWQNFCKAALKDSLKIKTQESGRGIGPRLLSLLSTLVKLFYPFNHEDVVSIFDMVTSHSEFLNVMLSHHSTEIKSRLAEFLYILILRNKSVMKSQQIPVYLSAYHATRNPSDRLLLTILHFYETNGQAVHEYKPYVWGDSGANYYAVRKNRSTSLWGHPTPNHILNLLDKEVIDNSIKHFPINQRLDYKYELPSIDETEDYHNGSASNLLERMKLDSLFKANEKTDVTSAIDRVLLRNKYDRVLNRLKEVEFTSSSHTETDEAESIYDPLFLLPMMSHLLAPGTVVSCFKLARAGLLGVPLMALSSHCPGMRAAGYHVLHRFLQQLETETKHRNDKFLLTDFFDTLRHSLSSAIITAQKEKDAIRDQKNPRVPAVVALYLARTLNVATAPFDPLYKPVNNFLRAKQQIDLTVVPDFLGLFHDSDVESSERRLWVLNVMKDGSKTMTDVNVVFKTMALKMVMDFYSTVLADKKTKEAILEFLNSMVSVPRASEILIEGYGLLSWLSSVVRDVRKEEKSLVPVMKKLINNLRISLAVNAFAKMLGDLKRSKEPQEKEGKRKEKDAYVDVNSFGELKVNKDIEQHLRLLTDTLPNIDIQ